LVESPHRDDSNKWSDIGFCEEITQVAWFCQGLKKVGRILSSLLKRRGDLNKNKEKINPLEILMG